MQKVLTTHYLPKVVGRVLLEGPDLNKVVLIQAAPLRELNRPLPPLEDRGFLADPTLTGSAPHCQQCT